MQPAHPAAALPAVAAACTLGLFALSCSRPTSKPSAPTAGEAPADVTPAGGPPEFMRSFMSPAEFEALTKPRTVTLNAPGAAPGYTLVQPLNSTKAHLLDLDGRTFHTWETRFAPGGWSYLQDDGTLLLACRQDEAPHFKGGGIGGILMRLAPDGAVLWRYDFADTTHCQHHDIEPLPNGNVLFIAWERHSAEEAIARGRDPRAVGAAGLWTDAVFEVRPTPPLGGELVWSWHAWDHLVQDLDSEKAGYGVLADHVHRIDINAGFEPPDTRTEEERRAEAERKQAMAALGYGGGAQDDEEDDAKQGAPPPATDWDKEGDWMHTNAVDYHADLDLVLLSSPELCEVFVIDHSTTPEQAASGSGGRYGRGGDLLWRWGNPANYGRGKRAAQTLFYQHDPQWLGGADDLRLTVFNNGGHRPDGTSYSEVLELALPFAEATGFSRAANEAFGIEGRVWSYSSPDTFFSAFISGASRLPNGDTLICAGAPGRIFEVTQAGDIVWEYWNGLGGDVEPPEHAGKAPPFALYRAARYAPDHPGIRALERAR